MVHDAQAIRPLNKDLAKGGTPSSSRYWSCMVTFCRLTALADLHPVRKEEYRGGANGPRFRVSPYAVVPALANGERQRLDVLPSCLCAIAPTGNCACRADGRDGGSVQGWAWPNASERNRQTF